jgi:C1A family cysteine protease
MAKSKKKQEEQATSQAGDATESTRKIQRYGWKPDYPDQRDFTYAVKKPLELATSVDLRNRFPTHPFDQGELGSCTANAIAGAIEFDLHKQNLATFTPSRLFIYYNERAIEGHVDFDSGAQIRDGLKSVAKQGVCKEGNVGEPPPAWPYDTEAFAEKPPQSCYEDAKTHRVLKYYSVTQNLADMQGCLTEGYPFVFGFTVYTSFETDDVKNTGIVPMPKSGERVVGGHAVLAVGYNDDTRMFLCRNSWGTDWGQGGYFEMPYAYLLDDNLADDFWTIRLMSPLAGLLTEVRGMLDQVEDSCVSPFSKTM